MMTLRWLVITSLAGTPAVFADNIATPTRYDEALSYFSQQAAIHPRVEVRVPHQKRFKGRLAAATPTELTVSGHRPIPSCEITEVRFRRSRLRLPRRYAGAVAGGASGFVLGFIGGILQPHRGMLKEMFIENPAMGAAFGSEVASGSPGLTFRFKGAGSGPSNCVTPSASSLGF